MSEEQYHNPIHNDLPLFDNAEKWVLFPNLTFLQNLQNEIEFNPPGIEFGVDASILSNECLKFSKELFKQLLSLILEYLPVNNNIFKAFQLIDPHQRTIQNSKNLFKEYLLKKICKLL